MGAVEHFLAVGKQQGRLQYTNFEQIATLREKKLKRLKLCRTPATVRKYGQPLDFLTSQLISEFEIPVAPPVSANQYGGPFIEEIANNPHRLCLDVGAGLRHSYSENVVNVEIYPSHTTDVLCVGEDLPFEGSQFDYVICAAVLEHTRRPWDVAREICRVLKPGGKVLVDYPFLQGVHGYPHHYFNATPRGSISLFEGHCDTVSSTIGLNNHPIQSIWWTLATWRNGLSEADNVQFDKLSVGEILAIPADQHLNKGYCANLSEEALRTIPAGSTLIAQKRPVAKAEVFIESHPSASAVDSPCSVGQRNIAERLYCLESEILSLRSSRSWRLTAPLRALFRTWRRRDTEARRQS